jgi:heme A synthase
MKAAVGLLAGWLLAALLLLAHDGRLPEYLAGATSASLLVLGIGALVRHQRAPLSYNRPSMPERYRVADDLRQPLAVVVAVAEAEAATGGQQEPPDGR